MSEKGVESRPNIEEQREKFFNELLQIERFEGAWKDLALTYLGEKPATIFGIAEEHSNEGKMRLEEACGRLEALLRQTNLSYDIRDEGVYHSTVEVVGKDFIVSNDPEKIRQIKEVLQMEKNSPEKHRKFGELMGTPTTAIDAFVERMHMPVRERRGVADAEFEAFTWFVPSKDHLQEEVAFVHEKAKKLKAAAPDVYEHSMESYTRERDHQKNQS